VLTARLSSNLIGAEWQIEQPIRPGAGSEHDKTTSPGRFIEPPTVFIRSQ
jgi:hypothetical protein